LVHLYYFVLHVLIIELSTSKW